MVLAGDRGEVSLTLSARSRLGHFEGHNITRRTKSKGYFKPIWTASFGVFHATWNIARQNHGFRKDSKARSVERCSFERKAEILPSTASLAKDFARARQNPKTPGLIRVRSRISDQNRLPIFRERVNRERIGKRVEARSIACATNICRSRGRICGPASRRLRICATGGTRDTWDRRNRFAGLRGYSRTRPGR